MMSTIHSPRRRVAPPPILRLALTLALPMALAACSATPDWANPVEWYRGASGWFEDDEEKARQREQAREEAEQAPGEGKDFPNLATVPDRPKNVSSEGDRRTTEEGLVADRERARHEPLDSGGSEPDAPPPPVLASPPRPRSSVARIPRPAPEPAPAPEPSPPEPEAGAQAPRASASSAGDQPSGDQPPATGTAPPPTERAEEGTDSGDGDGGLVARTYREALAQSAPTVTTAPPAAGMSGRSSRPSPGLRPPERGRIELKPPPSVPESAAAAAFREALPPAAEANGLGAPSVSVQVATIHFANGSARLGAGDRKALRSVVKLHEERGGRIRIEGHASMRTRDLDPLEHRLVNFRMSMQRASAVARQLVRMGVPREKVFVVARSDNEPIYHEFMPAGEAGNRRAEIYLDY